MNRADGGGNYVNVYMNINDGSSTVETDRERQDRTGLSSVRLTDDESKAVQKTPNRISLDEITGEIIGEEIIHPRLAEHMTIVVLLLRNGFVLTGKSTPADPENYDEALGVKFAKEDAIRQAWPLFAFALRERLHGQSMGDRSKPPQSDT